MGCPLGLQVIHGVLLATAPPGVVGTWLDSPTDAEQASLDAFIDELGVTRA